MSVNPEHNETEMEFSAEGDSAETVHEANAAEALEGAETAAMGPGHTVVVGSAG